MNLLSGERSKSGVIRRVERLVCDCVNEAFTEFTINRYSPASVSTLYDGVTNIPLTRRIARCAVFVVAHDRFGVQYNELKAHSGITCNNIMKSARKFKDTPECDDIVRKVKELIDVELEKFPIL